MTTRAVMIPSPLLLLFALYSLSAFWHHESKPLGQQEVWFYMELLDQDRADAWGSFLETDLEVAKSLLNKACISQVPQTIFKEPLPRTKYAVSEYLAEITDGTHAALDNIKYVTKGAQVWMVYASPVFFPGGPPELIKHANDIAIFMTVASQDGVPFQVHVGINRSYQFYLSDHVVPRRLSTLLHGFAAKTVLEQIDPGKVYMITNPTVPMSTVMKKSIPADQLFIGTFPAEEFCSCEEMDIRVMTAKLKPLREYLEKAKNEEDAIECIDTLRNHFGTAHNFPIEFYHFTGIGTVYVTIKDVDTGEVLMEYKWMSNHSFWQELSIKKWDQDVTYLKGGLVLHGNECRQLEWFFSAFMTTEFYHVVRMKDLVEAYGK